MRESGLKSGFEIAGTIDDGGLSPRERVDWNIAGETGPELIIFYIQGSEKILSLYYIDLFKVKLISIYKKVTLYTRSNILFIIILKEERKTKNGR